VLIIGGPIPVLIECTFTGILIGIPEFWVYLMHYRRIRHIDQRHYFLFAIISTKSAIIAAIFSESRTSLPG
jgi:hypothetical protein